MANKHRESGSASPVVREMQTGTGRRQRFAFPRGAAVKGTETSVLLRAGRDRTPQAVRCGRGDGSPCDSASPLPGVSPKEAKTGA